MKAEKRKQTWFPPATKVSAPSTPADIGDYTGTIVPNRNDRMCMDRVSMFMRGTDITFDIIDTETIKGTHSGGGSGDEANTMAIDFGQTQDDRRREDGNKGIGKLFIRKTDNLNKDSPSTNPKDTGHMKYWI